MMRPPEISLAYIKRYPNSQRTRSWAGRLVMISSDNGFWREGARGYCYARDPNVWRIPFEEAFERTKHCGPEKRVRYVCAATHYSLREANKARQKEWDEGATIDLCYRAVELSGEVGEALNIVKKLEREMRGIRGSRATLNDLADELADVAICLDLLVQHAGIDLEDAIERKFNATSKKNGLITRLSLPKRGSYAS